LKSISLEEIPDKLIRQPALAAAWMLGFLELFNALTGSIGLKQNAGCAVLDTRDPTD